MKCICVRGFKYLVIDYVTVSCCKMSKKVLNSNFKTDALSRPLAFGISTLKVTLSIGIRHTQESHHLL